MDGRRFDEWTRAVTIAASRRAALRAAAGAALADAFRGFEPSRAAAADAGKDATCRCAFGGNRFCQSEHCDFDEQCCSRKCEVEIFRRSGCGAERRCLCRFEGARCAKDCACCSGRCRRNGRCA